MDPQTEGQMAGATKKPGPSILLVEDDVDFRKVMETKLADSGFNVLSCRKLHEALMMLTNQKFDCIILDMQLEHKSGEAVITHIREEPRGFNYRTPVVVVSGALDAGILRNIRSEIRAALVKPVDYQDLLSKVTAACNAGAVADPKPVKASPTVANPRGTNAELDFLHDLASPIGTVGFLLDSLGGVMGSDEKISAEAAPLLYELSQVLQKINGLLSHRRAEVMKASKESSS